MPKFPHILVSGGGGGGSANPHTPADQTFKGVSLKKSAAQDHTTSNTFEAVTFDQEFFDTSTFHDTVTNNTRITIPASFGGYYLVVAKAMVNLTSAFATGEFASMDIFKNGTTTVASWGRVYGTAINDDEIDMELTRVLALVAGDFIEMRTYQFSGAAVTGFVRSEAQEVGATTFEATWLGV